MSSCEIDNKTTYKIDEIADRVRRIETRQAAYFVSIGYTTDTKKPTFSQDGTVHIPSMNTSIKDILECVPADFDGMVRLMHKGKFYGILTHLTR